MVEAQESGAIIIAWPSFPNKNHTYRRWRGVGGHLIVTCHMPARGLARIYTFEELLEPISKPKKLRLKR